MRIVLKIKVGGELLGEHPMGIMDHKGMTNLVTGISCASVPNLAAKKNTVSSLTEEALFFDAIPINQSRVPFDRPDRWLPVASLVEPIASVMSSR